MKNIIAYFQNIIKIKALKKHYSYIKTDAKTWNMWDHSGWGDSLHWSDWDRRRLYGFLKEPPKIGDILRSKMESGKIARFVFTNVEILKDPSDMFFANVSDLEYE